MTITEIVGNLFFVPHGYYLAHCISADYTLGAGIAKEFNIRYDMRYKLERDYPTSKDEMHLNVGKALLVDDVFNLVTKVKYYHKPTYDSLRDALQNMHDQIEIKDIRHLAMPHIASGLDKLEWSKVKEIIEEVFSDLDIDITICTLGND